MAEGKININRGKILIDNGLVQTCRCCEKPTCEWCPDTDPETWSVTITGLTACCINTTAGDPASRRWEDPNGLMDSFTLTRGVDCRWFWGDNIEFNYYYQAHDCVGTVSEENMAVVFDLLRLENSWRLTGQILVPSIPADYWATIFYADISLLDPDICKDTLSATNSWGPCGSAGTPWGTGGSASIVPD